MKKMIAGLMLASAIALTPIAGATSASAHAPSGTAHVPALATHTATMSVGERIIAIGASYRGVPYVWGGNSPRTGFDCSGFTKYVFARLGESIPRTAEGQYRAAHHTHNPQPGDLVFIHDSSGYVYHVAIYVNSHTWLETERPGRGVNYYRPWSQNVYYGFL